MIFTETALDFIGAGIISVLLLVLSVALIKVIIAYHDNQTRN